MMTKHFLEAKTLLVKLFLRHMHTYMRLCIEIHKTYKRLFLIDFQ